MEWVVTTGKSVEEAKERALDQLGVGEDEAEFEVLEEPKVGFLGLRKGDARVRARVRPSQPRPKAERRDRNRRDKRKREGAGREDAPAGGRTAAGEAVRTEEAVMMTEEPPAEPERAPARREAASTGLLPYEEHVAAVREFVEGLVGAFGIAGTVDVAAGEDETVVQLQGADIGLLIGPDGRTAEAIGDLSRSAVLRRAGTRETEGRVVVDVAGLRERRRSALERFAQAQAAAVRSDGQARVLEPMGSSDRKVVHDALIDAEGVQTLSEGEDPYRRVVIVPAS